MNMKPALSVMHATANSWHCPVIHIVQQLLPCKQICLVYMFIVVNNIAASDTYVV